MKKNGVIKLVSAFLIAALILFSSGCTTTMDPYTRYPKPSNASVGAGLGALSGALIGAMAGNSKGALIGAGLGAIAGGAIGNDIDQQEAMLRSRLDNTGVRVIREGCCLRLVMPCDITFANNSARIYPAFYETLDSVTLVLKRFNRTVVKVAGFTSDTGGEMYNQILSERRSRSVANYLVDNCIDPNRIMSVGYGLRYPVADNSTEEGRSLNRRVEITIRPLNNCDD